MLSEGFFPAAEAARRPFPLSDGTTAELPLCSYEAEMMLATFTVSAAKARALIPIPELVPVRLTPGRALLFVTALEYRRMCIGPYREFMIGIPAQRRPRFNIPLLPALLQEGAPGFSIYLTHIAVTTERARIVGWDLLGFPKFLADLSYTESTIERSCTAAEDGCLILSMTVRKARRFRVSEGRFALYSLSPADGKSYEVPYYYRMQVGMRLGRGAARLTLGEHPLADELRSLDISAQPLAARYAPQFCLITGVPPQPVPLPSWVDPRYMYQRTAGGAVTGGSM